MLVLKDFVGLHRTVQLQLLQRYWLGHRLGLLWYWMVCLGDEQRSFCRFWDCIQVLHFGPFCWPWWLLHFFWGIPVHNSRYNGQIWCCEEQYSIGTWNVRSMNKGKFEVVKQVMARVNVDILEISELKWTGMGGFNSDDHYIYYCGQESLGRNGVVIMVDKRVQNAVLGCNLKMTECICLFPRQTIQ